MTRWTIRDCTAEFRHIDHKLYNKKKVTVYGLQKLKSKFDKDNLTGVLIKFLQEVVALESDIEVMFHQVESDERLLKFPSILTVAIGRYE